MLRIIDARTGEPVDAAPARRGLTRVEVHAPGSDLTNLRVLLVADLLVRALELGGTPVWALLTGGHRQAELRADATALGIRPFEDSPDVGAGLGEAQIVHVTVEGGTAPDGVRIAVAPVETPGSATSVGETAGSGLPVGEAAKSGPPGGRPAEPDPQARESTKSTPPSGRSGEPGLSGGESAGSGLSGGWSGDSGLSGGESAGSGLSGEPGLPGGWSGEPGLSGGRSGEPGLPGGESAGSGLPAGEPAASNPPGGQSVGSGPLGGVDPAVLRLALLARHHSAPVRLEADVLGEAQATLARWRGAVARWARRPSRPVPDDVRRRLRDAWDDDLDVPRVLDVLRGVENEPDLPDGARFETYAYADRLLGLELTRDLGAPS
ncbi:hypothetical protein STAFG_7210 [Streptomyces afghaniensis 772]|uniref:Uncharacterized protein n=1 Tax=Streptomyces afghaniensis 772 TaxID=1283301 RepID=S4MQH4_9ACTN|nr:hypothetical protein STAFG_7210 [Streptomyces afghaniensis 772]